MLNVGVFFGSRAAEHDVSIISGLQILENADKAKYNAFPVYVSRKGEWFVGEPLKKIETYKPFDENMKGLTKVYLHASCGYYDFTIEVQQPISLTDHVIDYVESFAELSYKPN